MPFTPSDQAELSAWLRLSLTPEIGPATVRKLLERFGLPQQVLDTSFHSLSQVLAPAIVERLLHPDEAQQKIIAATFDWLEQPQHHVLTLADVDYPQHLLEIADPPPLLYLKGRRELLQQPGLAIVGSRHASTQGSANAEAFARTLSGAGLTVISGMALGIDSAAHRGALDAGDAAGSTIAVIGTGIDLVYPASNRALAHRIAEHGLIVSEFPLGSKALAHHFPRRNRVISGLARGVLVVEAAAASGSLITARQAGEQGREVFAIPGSIHSPLAKGCHQLIKQGAKLVESAQDILEELHLQTAPAQTGRDIFPTHPLLQHLGFDPCGLDELQSRSQLDTATLQAQLLELELQGQVQRLSGGKFSRLTQ
ncbi:MAG: DNA-protecting protein DprA [Burkholderiaceae bacterium]|nr:MAG: DNA-protecting protein DprA [Burkholderiaceae bacterium]